VILPAAGAGAAVQGPPQGASVARGPASPAGGAALRRRPNGRRRPPGPGAGRAEPPTVP